MNSPEGTIAAHSNVQQIVKVLFIILTCIVSIAAVVFHALAVTGHQGLFLNRMEIVLKVSETEYSPIWWAYYIWILIAAWQGLWLLYAVSNMFRKTPYGYLYDAPDILPTPVFMSFSLALGLHVAWVFLLDRISKSLVYLPISVAVIAALMLSLIATIVLAYHSLWSNARWLIKMNQYYDIWLVRLFVHNGLNAYLAWVVVMWLLNLSRAITSHANQAEDVSSTICLGLLSGHIMVYYFVDIILLDRFSRYVISFYAMLIWALGTMFGKTYKPGGVHRNSIFLAVLLAVAIAAFVVKVIFMLWRHFTVPLYTDNATPHLKGKWNDGFDIGRSYDSMSIYRMSAFDDDADSRR